MSFEQYVRGARAAVPQIMTEIEPLATRQCGAEVDVIGRIHQAIADAEVAAEDADLEAYVQAMVDLASMAISQAALARQPGASLSTSSE